MLWPCSRRLTYDDYYALVLTSGVFHFEVTELHEPDTLDLWKEALRPLLHALRATFLYHRIPYDRTYFAKLRDWRFLVMLYVASSPTLVLRGAFFTFYLIGIAVEHEEYQVGALERVRGARGGGACPVHPPVLSHTDAPHVPRAARASAVSS